MVKSNSKRSSRASSSADDDSDSDSSSSSSSDSNSGSDSNSDDTSSKRKSKSKSSDNKNKSKEEVERDKNREEVLGRKRQWETNDDDDDDGDVDGKKTKKVKADDDDSDSGDDDSDSDGKERKKDKKKKKKHSKHSKHSKSSKHSKKDKKDKKKKKSKKGKKHKKHKSSPSSSSYSSSSTTTTGPAKKEFGHYGILKESSYTQYQRIFEIWLLEVKKIPSFTGAKWELKEYFREFCEDFNTCSFEGGRTKFYDYEKWERDEFERVKKLNTTSSKNVSDEYTHQQTIRTKETARRNAELQDAVNSMSGEKIKEMKEQTMLQAEMAHAFKMGDSKLVDKIKKRLEPEDPRMVSGGAKHPWAG